MNIELDRRLFLGMLAGCALTGAIAASAESPAGTAADSPPDVPSSSRMEPAELAGLLKSTEAKPIVLQVGVRVLYEQSHIPGAEYIGAAGKADGLQALRQRAASLPKDRLIVLYCGCCPWTKCPNIRPAFNLLQSLGFKSVKALNIPSNLGADWVDKGYPAASGL